MIHPAKDVRAFFAWSDGSLDRMVLRPLSHITLNCELTWDHEAPAYEAEENSFAVILNQSILDLAASQPPERYHDNEDRLAQFVIESLGWPIHKDRGPWVGADYVSILSRAASVTSIRQTSSKLQRDVSTRLWIDSRSISMTWSDHISECSQRFWLSFWIIEATKLAINSYR